MNTTSKLSQMDVDVSLPVHQIIPDGALGDDERTEAERSPQGKSKSAPNLVAMCVEESPPSDHNTRAARSRCQSGGADVNGRRKKHRRGKNKGGKRHRQWKPYTKMTWDERKELEERETRRACQRREERFASGQPMAPYNTTQFLMEQQDALEFKLDDSKPRLNKSETGEGSAGGSGSLDGSSEDYYSSPDDEEIFLEKEFTEAYENYHAERLQTMTKDELVREYLELETKVETMEKSRLSVSGSAENDKVRVNSSNSNIELPAVESVNVIIMKDNKLSVSLKEQDSESDKLQEEIRQLRAENDRLRKENERLLTEHSISTHPANEGEP